MKTAKAFGPTRRLRKAPTVVVVTLSRSLLGICRRAVLSFSCADVQSVAIAQLATAVSSLRPFAIVIEEDLYAFDPGEMTALARDVGAVVIRVRRPDAPALALIEAIKPALRRAHALHFTRQAT